MFSASFITLLTLTVLSVSEQAFGREGIWERDGRPVLLSARRFGQENPAAIGQISAACDGGTCGTLAGGAITPLLAAQPECSQQDFADKIIDESKTKDAATAAKMVAAAVTYRQAEKNVAPDFSTQPPTNRRSVFCQKAPKNPELNCLVQAQDPATNDQSPFFDPATGKTVAAGSQRNTQPFCSGNNAQAGVANNAPTAPPLNNAADNGAAVAAPPAAPAAAPAAPATPPAAAGGNTGAAGIGNFGSCTVPQIKFAAGLDNRRETAFEPVDKQSFDHGSAQAIGIIAQSICDTLTNKCKADDTAKATCKTAQAAAAAAPAKTGNAADAFNNAFGIKTNFAAVQPIDDQGRPVGAATAGAGVGAGGAPAPAAQAAAPAAGAPAATPAAPAGANGATGGGAAAGGVGNFGSCTVPEIKFAAGLDGRKETSFEPVDKQSFNHGSAQNGAIITQSICDTLVNSCKADQTAKDTCAKAKAAFDAATPVKSGAQADAFNAVFGKKTNFAAVAIIDNQGKVVTQ